MKRIALILLLVVSVFAIDQQTDNRIKALERQVGKIPVRFTEPNKANLAPGGMALYTVPTTYEHRLYVHFGDSVKYFDIDNVTNVTISLALKQDNSDTSSTDATRYWVATTKIDSVAGGTGLSGSGGSGTVTIVLDTTIAATQTDLVDAIVSKQDDSDTTTFDATQYYVTNAIANKQDDSDTSSFDATQYYVSTAITNKQDDSDTTTFDATQYWTETYYEKKNGYRWTKHYDDFMDALKDNGSAPVSGYVFGLVATKDTVFATTQADMLLIDSNTEIRLPIDQELYLKKIGKDPGIKIFQAQNKRNILIDGGIYDGLADTTYYQEYDSGMFFGADTNVTVRYCHIKNMGGDCIDLSGGEGINIDHVIMECNHIDSDTLVGRCGIAITAGGSLPNHSDTLRQVKITNCVFRGEPSAQGFIDFEPNTDGVVEDVIIDNCTFYGNGLRIGIQIIMPGDADLVRNVLISNCNFYNVSNAVYIDNSAGKNLGNIRIVNCNAYGCTSSAYYLRGGCSDVKFDNCNASHCARGFSTYGNNIDVEYNNCEARYSLYDGIYFDDATPTSKMHRCRINGGRYYNNGTNSTYGGNGIDVERATELTISNVKIEYTYGYGGNGYSILLDGCDGVVIENCTFLSNNQDEPELLNTCNDIIEKGNIYGDQYTGKQTLKYDQYNYSPGWHRSVVLLDTTACDSFDTAIRIGGFGGKNHGATDVEKNHTASENMITFSGYRDINTNTLSAKIVNQNYATSTETDHHYWTQEANLLFYLLTDAVLPTTSDNTKLKMILTGEGIGLNDGSYITFSSDVSDSSWMSVGVNGYGFRDNSGTMQFKNSGGSWANITSNTGDVVGPSSATDHAIARYDLTTGKLIQNSSAIIDDSGQLGLGTASPACYLTIKPALPIGMMVTKEATPAFTDSSIGLGVYAGDGQVSFRSAEGDTSRIAVNHDSLLFQGASRYRFDNNVVLSGDGTAFDDMLGPAFLGKQTAGGKPDFSLDSLGYHFPQNDSTEYLLFKFQLSHKYKQESKIYPHVHWIQNQNQTPVFRIWYQWASVGEVLPAWSFIDASSKEASYTSGKMHQISYNATGIDGTGKGISSILLIKLKRWDNAYVGDCLVTDCDIHFEVDGFGSNTEYSK